MFSEAYVPWREKLDFLTSITGSNKTALNCRQIGRLPFGLAFRLTVKNRPNFTAILIYSAIQDLGGGQFGELRDQLVAICQKWT